MKWGYVSYIAVMSLGLLIAVGVFLKLFFGFNIDSDWFWFLTGAGLAVEGYVSLKKQMKFDRKFKIIERT